MMESTDKVKQAVAVVTALTALVTASTALVKALDKSVERVSYETLSEKVVELQKEVWALKQGATDYMPPEPVDAGLCTADHDQDGLLDTNEVLPVSPATSSSAPTMPQPEPSVSVPQPPTPPPSWETIELKAQR